jgi:hypothetical protein
MNGFIHIIESPSSEDLLDGVTEGRSLSEALTLAEIPHWYSLATSATTLGRALGQRLVEAWRHHHRLPILHLSMHGNQNGIALTNDVELSWNDLRQLLLPLNRAMKGGLLICMSTCFGSAGCRMAMFADNEPPFWALVGNTGRAAWSDSAVAYISFYHLFFKGYPIETCVESMKVASGDHNFVAQSGQKTKENWLAFVSHLGLGQLGPSIEKAAQEAQDEADQIPDGAA